VAPLTGDILIANEVIGDAKWARVASMGLDNTRAPYSG
jgi:hypothetical protein